MNKSSIVLVISATFILFGCTTIQNKSSNNEASKLDKSSKDIRFNVPIYAQKVSIKLPNQSWKPAFEEKKARSYRVELIPSDEVLEDWTNLISIQGLKDYVKKHYSGTNKSVPLTSLFSFRIKQLYQLQCPKGKFVFDRGSKVEINTTKYLSFIMGCLVPSKVEAQKAGISKGELGYYILIEGTEDLYVIHKSVRGSESFLKEELNEANLAEFISPIEPIKLCKKTGHMAECLQ